MRVIFAMLVAALVLVGGQAAVAEPAAKRCHKLIAFYDRYVQWINEETPLGCMQREIGEQECKRGRYQSGIAELEMAIRLIGFQAPPG